MTQVPGARPFDECDLADQPRFHPAALFDFLSLRLAIRPTARPSSRADWLGSLQRLESREGHVHLAHRVNGKTWCVTSVASQRGDDSPLGSWPSSNSRHERFAQGVASGLSGSETYRQFLGAAAGKNADVMADQLMNQHGVRERIAELKEANSHKATLSREKVIDFLCEVITASAASRRALFACAVSGVRGWQTRET
jgi:hypothetical protein